MGQLLNLLQAKFEDVLLQRMAVRGDAPTQFVFKSGWQVYVAENRSNYSMPEISERWSVLTDADKEPYESKVGGLATRRSAKGGKIWLARSENSMRIDRCGFL